MVNLTTARCRHWWVAAVQTPVNITCWLPAVLSEMFGIAVLFLAGLAAGRLAALLAIADTLLQLLNSEVWFTCDYLYF